MFGLVAICRTREEAAIPASSRAAARLRFVTPSVIEPVNSGGVGDTRAGRSDRMGSTVLTGVLRRLERVRAVRRELYEHLAARLWLFSEDGAYRPD
jgi:hypothetical protein